MGAEDHVIWDGSSSHFLELGFGETAHQMMGGEWRDTGSAIVANTDTAVLKSRLIPSTARAHITVAESPVRSSSMNWYMVNEPAGLSPEHWSWKFEEQIAGTGLVEMVPSSTIENGWESDSAFANTGAWLKGAGSSAPTAAVADNMVMTWRALDTWFTGGRVRLSVRIARRKATFTDAFDYTIRHRINGGGAVLLAGGPLTPVDDIEGHVIRVQADLGPKDKLVVRLDRTGPPATEPTELMLDPLVEVLGRRITYVYNGPVPQDPSPDHHYVAGTAPAGGVSVETAGDDFESWFGTPARAPLFVELRNPWEPGETGATSTGFDDLSCRLDWPDADPSQLRADILAEAAWARDLWYGLRNATNPYTEYLGQYLDGSKQTPLLYGGQVAGQRDFLRTRFRLSDWEEVSWIEENELHLPRTTGGNLLFARWDNTAGDYDVDQNNINSSARIGLAARVRFALDSYDWTDDPEYLDIAYNCATKIAATGVLDYPTGHAYEPHNDLIYHVGYHPISAVSDPSPEDLERFHETNGNYFLTAPAALVRTFVAATLFNADHPTVSPARYDAALLSQWLPLAETAIDKTVQIRRGELSPSIPVGLFRGRWIAMHGQFNDMLGYQSTDAEVMLTRIDSSGLSGPQSLLDIRNLLLRPGDATWDPEYDSDDSGTPNLDILRDGATHFRPLWTQATGRSAYIAGDSPRAWGAYRTLINHPITTDPDERQAYANQMYDVSRMVFKSMVDEGVWVDEPLDFFQRVCMKHWDDSGREKIAAPNGFIGGLADVLLADESYLSQPRREELFALAAAALRVTTNFFLVEVGGQERGYWPGLAARQAGLLDVFAEHELRTLCNFLRLIPILETEMQFDPPPTIAISPGHLQHTATSAIIVHLDVPDSQSQADLDQAFEERTEIHLWEETPTDWQSTRLWGTGAANPVAPIAPPPTGILWERTYDTSSPPKWMEATPSNVPASMMTGRFKLKAVTWDAYGRWTQATSYQE